MQFIKFPLHIWILLQIVIILIVHTCHFNKVVWTHPHFSGPGRQSKASVQQTDSRSGFSLKIWFIWYIKLIIWVTSNFISQLLHSYPFGLFGIICVLSHLAPAWSFENCILTIEHSVTEFPEFPSILFALDYLYWEKTPF